MTPGRSSEDFIARLARDLEPVRPVAALRQQLLAVAAIWGASALVVAGWLGLHPLAVLGRDALSATLAVVLVGVGLAGVTLGLVCRIPGQERLALASAGAVAAGVGIAAGIALVWPGVLADSGLAQSRVCIGRSLLLALPSGALALRLALRGAPWRAVWSGLGLSVGAVALGGLLVHLSCPSPSAWHWLFAHALAPLAAAVPAGLLAGWLLWRLSRPAQLRLGAS